MSQLRQKFILTQDSDTAKKLNEAGFHLISQENGMFKFINKTPENFTFDNFDMKKICFTNLLSL